MLKHRKRSGFKLIELLIVLVILGIIIGGFGLVGGVVMGNFWVGEISALEAIQADNASMVKLVSLERHVWGSSQAIAQDADGNRQEFLLDACILQNTTATPAPAE